MRLGTSVVSDPSLYKIISAAHSHGIFVESVGLCLKVREEALGVGGAALPVGHFPM